jgi:methionyl-tRNA synthetase
VVFVCGSDEHGTPFPSRLQKKEPHHRRSLTSIMRS